VSDDRHQEGWRGQAFGLLVEATEHLPGMFAATGALPRRTRWSRVDAGELRRRWPPGDADPVVHRAYPDGREFLRIEAKLDVGFMVRAPGFGAHLVAADGSAVASSLPEDGGRQWQRLFFAQVLPLAAASAGLDLFHASAASLGGRVFAFVASSGTGKTSVVAHLVASGADFVTDDVLALHVHDGLVRAYPGAGCLSIDAAELGTLEAGRRKRVVAREWGVVDQKSQVDVPEPSAATDLGGVFFLHRTGGDRLTVSAPSHSKLIPNLLGSAFLPYYRSRERLTTHLEVAVEVAARIPVLEVSIPRGTRAAETAAHIRAFGTAEGLWPGSDAL
jgi:hypothetical protein